MKALAAWILIHGKETALAVVAVFLPVQSAVITICCLVTLDFILGVWAAKKRGEQITSSGFKTTVAKCFLYLAALLISFLVEQYLTGPLFPVSRMVSSLVGLVEMKSLLENLDGIYGQSVFAALIKRLSQKPPDQTAP